MVSLHSPSLSDVVFPAPRGHKNLHSQCQFSSGLNCVCKMIWALLPYNNLDLELVRTIALLPLISPSLSFFFSTLVISQTLILRATAYRLWARAMLVDANLMSHLCRLCRRPVAIVICVSLKGYKWTPTPTTVTAPTPHTLYTLSLLSSFYLFIYCRKFKACHWMGVLACSASASGLGICLYWVFVENVTKKECQHTRTYTQRAKGRRREYYAHS